MKEFNYMNAPQSDSVVILGGGQSVERNKNTIIKYIEENNSLVFSANYKYDDFQINFIVFSDSEKFLSVSKFAGSGGNFIFRKDTLKKIKRKSKERWINLTTMYNLYYVGDGKRKKDNDDRAKIWKIDKNGTIKFYPITCGPTAIVSSLACRPKKMFIAGMYGPIIEKEDSKKLIKSRFFPRENKWRNVYYRSREHFLLRKKVYKLLVPLIRRKEITIEVPKDSPFWGMDKEKFNIIEI